MNSGQPSSSWSGSAYWFIYDVRVAFFFPQDCKATKILLLCARSFFSFISCQKMQRYFICRITTSVGLSVAEALCLYPCIEKQENDHLMPFDLCYQFRSMNQKILDNIACFYKSCFNEKKKELFHVIKVLLAL